MMTTANRIKIWLWDVVLMTIGSFLCSVGIGGSLILSSNGSAGGLTTSPSGSPPVAH